jgi:pimeloyl-ACP methyl ester carboxylesterase
MASINTVSMDDYAQRVADVASSAEEPVVLVGHSMGGFVISAAAERAPEAVAKLVYLAAFLLEDGQTLGELAATDVASQLPRNLVVSADGASLTVAPGALRGVFYHDCSDDDLALAELALGPESRAALAARLHTTTSRWGRIPRAYIECTQDRAVSIETQRAMTARVPCRSIVSMDTSHSPFFSAPERLARHLAEI